MKKALSPLISTILLIFFAVVMGVFIMNWADNIENKELSSCRKIELSMISNNDCSSIMLENIGSIDIDSFFIGIIDGNEAHQIEKQINLNIGEIKNINIDAQAEKIKITPLIYKNGLCPKQGIIIDCKNV